MWQVSGEDVNRHLLLWDWEPTADKNKETTKSNWRPTWVLSVFPGYRWDILNICRTDVRIAVDKSLSSPPCSCLFAGKVLVSVLLLLHVDYLEIKATSPQLHRSMSTLLWLRFPPVSARPAPDWTYTLHIIHSSSACILFSRKIYSLSTCNASLKFPNLISRAEGCTLCFPGDNLIPSLGAPRT